MFKRRVRVDEDQEGIVDHAFTDLGETVKEFAAVIRDTRADVANAFRGESVDEAALAAIFARQDEVLAAARRDAVSAFKQIHVVLDDQQRSVAADWFGATQTRWV